MVVEEAATDRSPSRDGGPGSEPSVCSPGGTGPAGRRARWVLAICVFLLVCTVAQVWADAGALVRADHVLHDFPFRQRWPSLVGAARVTDLVGQRGPTAALVLLVAAVLGLRQRRWRPVVVTAAALLTINLVVGLAKLGFGRKDPAFDDPELFQGGLLFPSGHAANVVLIWGMLAYLLAVYGPLWHRRRALGAGVAGLTLLMGVTAVYRDTHWMTDMLAGFLIGAIVLQAVVLLDAARAEVAVGRALRRVRRRLPVGAAG
ncbi:Membrane-associated phospholipid phosphatase [Haloechinothrix alba]|uniref:Membrane-associated phospholipid phosphatase n=1 Tax=Haloechinothrix alba TaxID=664784 RepID=A0A238WU75_9PSEU|nr:phosphatase PAP2 family protein [Haloechinothrix alba]SNR49963.1 Membrane-associated phospholipid phosphatase [Haloechinothrix alba]